MKGSGYLSDVSKTIDFILLDSLWKEIEQVWKDYMGQAARRELEIRILVGPKVPFLLESVDAQVSHIITQYISVLSMIFHVFPSSALSLVWGFSNHVIPCQPLRIARILHRTTIAGEDVPAKFDGRSSKYLDLRWEKEATVAGNLCRDRDIVFLMHRHEPGIDAHLKIQVSCVRIAIGHIWYIYIYIYYIYIATTILILVVAHQVSRTWWWCFGFVPFTDPAAIFVQRSCLLRAFEVPGGEVIGWTDPDEIDLIIMIYLNSLSKLKQFLFITSMWMKDDVSGSEPWFVHNKITYVWDIPSYRLSSSCCTLLYIWLECR